MRWMACLTASRPPTSLNVVVSLSTGVAVVGARSSGSVGEPHRPGVAERDPQLLLQARRALQRSASARRLQTARGERQAPGGDRGAARGDRLLGAEGVGLQQLLVVVECLVRLAFGGQRLRQHEP